MSVSRKWDARRYSFPRGIALIFVAGVLTILAAIGMAFFAITTASVKSAVRYADMVRAEMLAQAGIAEAVAQIRASTFRKIEDPTDCWYTTDWLHSAAQRISLPFDDGSGQLRPYTRALGDSVGESSDRYAVTIRDGQGLINVNVCDNLAVILDNLCRLIGAPMVSADPCMIQPRRWFVESNGTLTEYAANAKDDVAHQDLYFELDANGRPVQDAAGTAIYGDGYAIAGYRGRNGLFSSIMDVRNALTFIDRNGNGIADDPLEQLEIETKFALLKPYVTVASWVDTDTVCVGKFEWVGYRQVPVNGVLQYRWVAIDRDKSWVARDYADEANVRGDLRGSYVSIVNGHGAGQLRRIETNGVDWIAIEPVMRNGNDCGFVVSPGPISSYMIIAREDAKLEDIKDEGGNLLCRLPQTDAQGRLVDDPAIDYKLNPLCIHRAPINLNTAPDKVLAALFMGLNVQHGHPMAIGTKVDLSHLNWSTSDSRGIEDYILTFHGLKRVPVDSGDLFFDGTRTVMDLLPAGLKSGFDFGYLDNQGQAGINEAMELALRIIVARQRTVQNPASSNPDPFTDDGTGNGYNRGPLTGWDDLYFRVIRPWDELRFAQGWTDTNGNGVPDGGDTFRIARRARLIMANCNSNTDVLKFNPNIEWIDRWGRNFTEMEPVMVYTENNAAAYPVPANPVTPTSVPIFKAESSALTFGTTLTFTLTYYLKDYNSTVDGAYIVRSSRYKSDEMLDKTDLNRSTTECCFSSNGIFLISSIGQVFHPSTNQLLSERVVEAAVKVYDVWRESTQAQFVEGTISEAACQSANGAFGEFNRSGRIARDGYHSGLPGGDPIRRLALNTGPEPLVPLGYKILNASGNAELSEPDAKARDAFGLERKNTWDIGVPSIQVPDVLANRVLPARYDGQIMLAVNTPRYDDSDAGDRDSFLACFVGDLDTDTSRYNGREQAKVPHTPSNDGYKYRVVDTFGMLGLLNDTLVDVDPDLPVIQGDQWVTYCYKTINNALRGLDGQYYYNNVQCRMGDLRPDGVYLGCPGISGNDATLKYPIGPAVGPAGRIPNPDPTQAPLVFEPTPVGNSLDKTPVATPGAAPVPGRPVDAMPKDQNTFNDLSGCNFSPNSSSGIDISMWVKSTWHHDDHRGHEFFNCANDGYAINARCFRIAKEGRYFYSSGATPTSQGMSEQGYRKSDLTYMIEGRSSVGTPAPSSYPVGIKDRDLTSALHGGYNCVKASRLAPAAPNPESPGFRIQPFRWCMLGGRLNYRHKNTSLTSWVGSGHWKNSETNATNVSLVNRVMRPFISTSTIFEDECNKAGLSGRYVFYYSATHGGLDNGFPTDIGAPGPVDLEEGDYVTHWNYGGETGQDARWAWADPVQPLRKDPAHPDFKDGEPTNGFSTVKVFSLNNLNYGGFASRNQFWHYRHVPDDGTYSVIDALKISLKDRVLEGQNDWTNDRILNEMMTSRYYMPANPSNLAECPNFTSQTLFESTKGKGLTPGEEEVSVVRVVWSVFTPRFMHEEKKPGLATPAHPFKRKEYIGLNCSTTPNTPTISFKGPFDYLAYNDDRLISSTGTDLSGRIWKNISVARPDNRAYAAIGKQSHAGTGVQIQLFAAPRTQVVNGTAVPLATNNPDGSNTFKDPGDYLHNTLGSPLAPVRAKVKDLRYQVRFVYPVDQLVDPYAAAVDPGKHILLDTPIFDDISVTYFSQIRYLEYRRVTE